MFFYNLLLTILFYIFYPILFLIFRNNHFKLRIKIKPYYLDNTIWIHASSVGEVNAVKPLLIKLIEKYPKHSFLMTCMTKTGLETAKKLSSKLVVYPFPFDTSRIMKKMFQEFKPKLIILVETEIWPNMLTIANDKKIPVVIVNGRISDRSYPKYKFFKLFWKTIFKKISSVNAQSENDAQRFSYLGCKKVYNSNNLKFSNHLPAYDESQLRKAWKFNFNDFIITFGSTRPGEEKLIYEIGKRLKFVIPRLKIIVVPRHLYRMNEVCSLFHRSDYSLFSENYPDRLFTIIDEMGILPQVYAISDVSIIGGSFYNFGGHNPIEAAIYEKAVIIGPYHHSCLDIVNKFKQNNGIVISSTDNLYQDIINLANFIEVRKNYGKNALQVIQENQNSIDLHLNHLFEYFKNA